MGSSRAPVVFVGHGSPMNAIEDNPWSRGWRAIAASLPRPRAIVAISAHWYVPGTYATGNAHPRTIHDFGGFPGELYEIRYPAPGDPPLASRLGALVGAETSDEWGLDHGTWSVLRWMYPGAEIPTVQLSIDHGLSPSRHLELARGLTPLRDDGVLIFASGNVTHNLRDAFGRMRSGDRATPDWARRFDSTVREIVLQRDWPRLLTLWPDSEDGRRSHPTGDHYLPLIYACATATDSDEAGFPIEGFDLGSLSMRSIVFRPKDPLRSASGS